MEALAIGAIHSTGVALSSVMTHEMAIGAATKLVKSVETYLESEFVHPQAAEVLSEVCCLFFLHCFFVLCVGLIAFSFPHCWRFIQKNKETNKQTNNHTQLDIVATLNTLKALLLDLKPSLKSCGESVRVCHQNLQETITGIQKQLDSIKKATDDHKLSWFVFCFVWFALIFFYSFRCKHLCVHHS